MQILLLDWLFRPELSNGVKGEGYYSDSSKRIVP